MGTTNGKRNRNAGHAWERECVDILTEVGFEGLCTSRAENRNRDNEKVDVVRKNEIVNGRFEFNVQAKTSTKAIAYPKLLAEMPVGEETNVILHKQTEKSEKGRFIARGRYAILELNDFIKIVGERNKLKKAFDEFVKYIDYIPDTERRELEDQLKVLGL
jgi:hypothetical protein